VIALIGFGADSLIELLAGTVIVWLFTGGRGASHAAERRAQQLIAISFYDSPCSSRSNRSANIASAPTMPLLARAKRRVGIQLNSPATVKEGAQNMVCAYLSIALLVGLLLNALAGRWWADPAAALVIAAVAVREGRESWKGNACGCC
jgi:hypothetical protein